MDIIEGDVGGIPESTLLAEEHAITRTVGPPSTMATETFLSALRQERLLSRLCVAMELIASELASPPKGKPRR